MTTLAPTPVTRTYDNSGLLAIGASVYTYVAGTSTPQSTYTDSMQGTPNANPVVANSRGEVTLWLGNSLVYKLIAYDALGNLLWSSDGLTGGDYASISSATNLANNTDPAKGSALVGYFPARAGAVGATVQAKLRESISVLDFGADPTGVVDSTAYFNIATKSTTPWSSSLEYNVDIPPGHYRIDGTVYVRKGQTLRGSGHGVFINCSGNTTSPSFTLGNGFISGVVTADAGGSPVKIENMWTSGGSATRGVIYTNAAGFSVQNMFMTFPGTGIEINGADGLISNVEIDQCLTGIQLAASQNILFSNLQIYLPNYGIVINSDCRDITFNGGVIEYAQYASILFGDSQTNIKSILFSGIDFPTNVQYPTFLGCIYKRSSAVEAQFTGCSFRNMYNWAIQDASGVGCNLTFTGCVFDGNRTTSAYSQSSTAKVINTGGVGAAGIYNFMSCEFRNLLGEIATVNDGVSQLSLIGGSVQGCDINAASQKRFNIVTSLYQKFITVKNVLGFPYQTSNVGNQFAVLPYWSGCTQWKVSVKGNTFQTGSTAYSRAEEGIASVSTAYNGTSIVEYCDYTQTYKTPTRSVPPDIALAVVFGISPGGASSQSPITKGTICVSSPTTSANALGFNFFAETLT